MVTIEANFFSVASPQGTVLCTLRATLKKAGKSVKVGDRVRLENSQDERPVIAEVLPRHNELHRPAIANIDQLLIVMAAQDPLFLPLMADRLLLQAAYYRLTPVLCINKADLMPVDQQQWLQETYHTLGIPLLFVSARTGAGLEQLHRYLHDKTTVFAGPSGAGKSSLVNRLQPGLQLQTGKVSEKIGLGKHTTRQVSLFPLQTAQTSQGWLADTPGFQVLELPDFTPQQLGFYYPEFQPWLGQCEYPDCVHAQEPGCQVQAQLDTTASRYQNYLVLLNELRLRYQHQKKNTHKQEKRTKQQAAGQNQHKTLIKVSAASRNLSRRNQRQQIEALEDWANQDLEGLEEFEL